MKYLVSILLSIFLSYQIMALEVNYKIGMEDPDKHYFQLEMEISGNTSKDVLVKMPVWTPGSYKIREYGRYVEGLQASSARGKLQIEKQTKNSWLVKANSSSKLRLSYKVYAFQENIRMSFLDEEHAFITGTTMFMYVDGNKESAGKLEIVPFENFKRASSALDRLGDFQFAYKNYDHLVDCPIEIGNHEVWSFEAHGVNYEIAMVGKSNVRKKKFIADVATICGEANKVFGENPNAYYLFIIHNTQSRGGGLEHTNSTVLQLNRDSYKPEGQYERALGLVAHEYFHVWNVKRIRAEAMGPFDYDKEIYTDLLWLFEGFTSYYDKLLLYRAGYKTRDEFINTLLGTLRSVEAIPGSQVQSLRESSLDTWVKTYITDENSINTGISYYSKGSLLALLLDMLIVDETKGAKNLDDFMQALYQYSEKGAKPINYQIVKKLASETAGKNLDKFFETHAERPGTFDYSPYFSKNGVGYKIETEKQISLGIILNKSYVQSVLRGSAAEKAGIYARDIILKINGESLALHQMKEIGELEKESKTWKIVLLRKGIKRKITLPAPIEEKQKIIMHVSNAELANRWLNGKE